MTHWRSRMEKIRGIIFDLDDTLYPYRQFVMSGFGAVAEWLEDRTDLPFGRSFPFLKERFDAGERHTNLDTLVERFGLECKLLPKIVSIYRKHRPIIRCFPDAEQLIASLPSHIRKGMVTDGHSQTQRRKLRALGLEGAFSPLLISEEMGPAFRKPSERPYLLVMEQWEMKPSEILVAGDDPSRDLMMPRQLGMNTALVCHPSAAAGRVGTVGRGCADFVVRDFRKLATILSES